MEQGTSEWKTESFNVINMEYRLKRHITNTLLYAVIITALAGVIIQYTKLGAVAFLIVSVVALAADRYVENKHLKGKG
jgi:hypothetical protein